MPKRIRVQAVVYTRGYEFHKDTTEGVPTAAGSRLEPTNMVQGQSGI